MLIEQIFQELGYEPNVNLFYHRDADQWADKFPYRISRVLKDIIKPYAFFCMYWGDITVADNHPAPLNNPYILFFDRPSPQELEQIPQWTFSFSQAPIVIINPDDYSPLEIYHGYDFKKNDRNVEWLKKIENADRHNFHAAKLATGETWETLFDNYYKNSRRSDERLLEEIRKARRLLTSDPNGILSQKAANRLIGRLLFLRYLIDRDVELPDPSFTLNHSKKDRQKELEKWIRDKNKLYNLFQSIADTFNGDLFPLKEVEGEITLYDEQEEVCDSHLEIMHALFSGAEIRTTPGSKKPFQSQPSLFGLYDFAIIPVEVISNIYEIFLSESQSHESDKNKNRQSEIKAFYTPPFLVDYILSETVAPFLEQQSKASCRVLDPACGSGIFLVETLRKLIEKEIRINASSVIPDERLWEIVNENIFGIDIDAEAIEITLFSLFITILDYKDPKEIRSFRFRPLKGVNLFGGKDADFFNVAHLFNQILSGSGEPDFIIGNLPWGKSSVTPYCNRYLNEGITGSNDATIQSKKDGRPAAFGISGKDISQAFLIRAGDFLKKNNLAKCSFIVNGKNFYNSNAYAWRQNFLKEFRVITFLDLTALSNKSAGGHKLFFSANASTVILTYRSINENIVPGENVIIHITARADFFWNIFKTIVISSRDVKRIAQKYFMALSGGSDALWKILVHGNLIDYRFIRRLTAEPGSFPTLSDLMKENNLKLHGGFKGGDRNVKKINWKDTSEIQDWDYLEINDNNYKQNFEQFLVSPSFKFSQKLKELYDTKKIDSDFRVPVLPSIQTFGGARLLIKNGLSPYFQAFAAFCDENLVYSDSVGALRNYSSVTGETNEQLLLLFHTLAGLFNSDLFSYFQLLSGSSAGVEITRANFVDYLSFPSCTDEQIGQLARQIWLEKKRLRQPDTPLTKEGNNTNKIRELQEQLKDQIYKSYSITPEEHALINYAHEVSIPQYKRKTSGKMFQPLAPGNREHEEYLRRYVTVFEEHFRPLFNSNEKYFQTDIHLAEAFTGIHFKIAPKPDNAETIAFIRDNDVERMVKVIGNLAVSVFTRQFYVRRDVRGFNKNSFYIIKANLRKNWHPAEAYADLSEFVHSLVRAEMKRNSA